MAEFVTRERGPAPRAREQAPPCALRRPDGA